MLTNSNFWHKIASLLHIISVKFPPTQKYLASYFVRFSLDTSSLRFSWHLSIILYVSWNVSQSNLLTQELSDKVYLVMYLSFISDMIFINLTKASDSSLSVPFMYLIIGTYSSNSKLQKSTIFVVNISYVISLWSIYTVIQLHDIIVHTYFVVITLLDSTIYVEL